MRVDPEENRLTVAMRESGKRVKIDPANVNLEAYHAETRRFAQGERVQVTTAYRPPREEPKKGKEKDMKEKREQEERPWRSRIARWAQSPSSIRGGT